MQNKTSTVLSAASAPGSRSCYLRENNTVALQPRLDQGIVERGAGRDPDAARDALGVDDALPLAHRLVWDERRRRRPRRRRRWRRRRRRGRGSRWRQRWRRRARWRRRWRRRAWWRQRRRRRRRSGEDYVVGRARVIGGARGLRRDGGRRRRHHRWGGRGRREAVGRRGRERHGRLGRRRVWHFVAVEAVDATAVIEQG